MPSSAKKDDARTRIGKEKVLLGLQRGWSLSGAARFAGYSRSQVINWQDRDPGFALACVDAKEVGIDGLEDVATGRAKRKSDVLMMFMLNGARPEKYKRKMEVDMPKALEVHVKRFGKEK